MIHLAVQDMEEVANSYNQQVAKQGDYLIWWLIGIVFLMLAVLIYFLIRWQLQVNKIKAEYTRLFNDVIEGREFADEEKALLQKMVSRYKLVNPYLLVSSLKIFDRCVEMETAGLMNSGLSKKEQEAVSMRLSRIRQKLGFRRPDFGRPLVSTREIDVGQTLHIISQQSKREHVILARVVDVDEMDIVANCPDKLIDFKIGQELTCYFWRENDAGYYFKTSVLGQVATPMQLIFLSHSNDLDRQQRRHFYRINTHIPAKIYHISAEQLQEIKKTKEYIKLEHVRPIDIEIEDLSGGGLAFYTEQPIRKNDLFTVMLDLKDDEPPLQVAVKTLHAVIEERNKVKGFVIRGEFAGINETKRGRIIRYVYKEQINECRIQHEE